jgi:hypothetical protein
MRPLIAVALFVSACSESKAPVAKSCVAADGPTLLDAVKRCERVYIEEESCFPRQISERDGVIHLVHEHRENRFRREFGIRTRPEGTTLMGGKLSEIDALGNEIPDPYELVTGCVTIFQVTTLENGVFEIRNESPMGGGPPTVSYWHVDKARCETSQIRRKALLAGMAGGCS